MQQTDVHPVVGRWYHLGVFVDDLERAMAAFGSLGLTWAPATTSRHVWEYPNGERSEVDLHVTYSKEAPHVELVQGGEQLLDGARSTALIHHLGYWVDDLDRAVEALEATGWAVTARGNRCGLDRPTYCHMHREDAHVELVARAAERAFTSWLQSG